MSFVRSNKLLFTATVNSNNAAFLDGQIVPMTEFAGAVSTCALDESLWHRRFCHLNKGDVQKLIKGEMVSGIDGIVGYNITSLSRSRSHPYIMPQRRYRVTASAPWLLEASKG